MKVRHEKKNLLFFIIIFFLKLKMQSIVYVVNEKKSQNEIFLNKVEVFPIISLLLFGSLYISFQLKQIHLLGTIGHASKVISFLYQGINANSFYFLLGHFFLCVNSVLSMIKIKSKTIDYLKSMIGIISHCLFSFNFLRLFINHEGKVLGFKKYLYFMMIFANIGFVLNYHYKYLKKYGKEYNENHEQIIKTIFFQSLIVFSFNFLYILLTNMNYQIYSNVIMTTYFFSQLYLMNYEIEY